MNPTYSYQDSGFDKFLSRSIDDTAQPNLGTGGPVSNSIAYDRNQVSGSLGDSLRVGRILINGTTGRISIYDEANNEVVRIGELDG
jgi:hypothetical protein